MKAAATLLIAAAAVAPALAQSYYYEDSALVSREDLEDLADVLARDYGYDIEARDFDDVNELDMRELYDELYEREPLFRHLKNFVNKLRGKGGEAQRHEHEGLHEHQGHLGEHHGLEHHGFGEHQGLEHHGFGGPEHHGEFAHHGGFPGGSHDAFAAAPAPPQTPSDPSQYGRRSYDDMEEFEARDVEPEYEELLSRYFDDLYERELAAEDEYTQIAARAPQGDDFGVELVQRSPEPNIIEWFKNLFHPHRKQDEKKKKEEAEKKKKEQEAKSKAATTTTDSPKSTDKPSDNADDSSSVDAREFDDFWYDLD